MSCIIQYSKLLGDYNAEEVMYAIEEIIQYSKLLGDYNTGDVGPQGPKIIQYSKLLGDYNQRRRRSDQVQLYSIQNC